MLVWEWLQHRGEINDTHKLPSWAIDLTLRIKGYASLLRFHGSIYGSSIPTPSGDEVEASSVTPMADDRIQIQGLVVDEISTKGPLFSLEQCAKIPDFATNGDLLDWDVAVFREAVRFVKPTIEAFYTERQEDHDILAFAVLAHRVFPMMQSSVGLTDDSFKSFLGTVKNYVDGNADSSRTDLFQQCWSVVGERRICNTKRGMILIGPPSLKSGGQILRLRWTKYLTWLSGSDLSVLRLHCSGCTLVFC